MPGPSSGAQSSIASAGGDLAPDGGPPQPSVQAPALVTGPQQLARARGNLFLMEPQPLAKAPGPPLGTPAAPTAAAAPTAVLIAAAPERLGPPETGHRIVLGSQAPGEHVIAPDPHQGAPPRLPGNPLAPAATPPSDRGDAQPATEAARPPGAAAADAQPGPSDEQPPHIRGLIHNVVSVQLEPLLARHTPLALSVDNVVPPGQLDLFPDVQEACVVELIRKNGVTDLNV